MSDILQRLEPIFRDVLDEPSFVLTRESSPANVENWDSLAQISLITSIEKEFAFRFSVGEVQSLKTVGDMADLLERKLRQ
ncbi:MAG: acyl carrier protein [Thermoanaerobaculia bacterium]|jgi:acyl carrier protein|nr:acyl carrier protein [Thermoanaerobaculia bacterium]